MLWHKNGNLLPDSDLSRYLPPKMKKVSLILSLIWSSLIYAQVPVLGPEGYYLLDLDGDTMTNRAYDYMHPRSGNSWLVIDDGEFNYISSRNYRKLSPQDFHVAFPFHGHFALVARNHYHYLSDEGKLFGTFDYGIQPAVIHDFLLYQEDERYKVVNPSGKVFHETPYPLFAASQTGIFEWQKDKELVIQYYAYYGSFREVARYENVDTLAFNHQGYAFIEQDSLFCVPDSDGTLRFSNIPASNYYLMVQVYWGQYLYLGRIHEIARNFSNDISSFKMGDSRHCYNGNSYGRGPAVELGNPFHSIHMARLSGSYKWVQFSGSDDGIDGNHLFDEVLPSDHRYLIPVRKEMTWYLFNDRNQELQELPWRFIHPYGLKEGRFFGSNQDAAFWQKQWAYQSLDSLAGGPEEYQFIKGDFDLRRTSPLFEYYLELPDAHRMIKNGDTVWLNTKGQVFAKDQYPDFHIHTPLDIIQPEIYLNARKQDPLESRRGYDRRKVGAYLKPTEKGILMEVVNPSRDTVYIESDYDKLKMQLEYQVNESKWKAISYASPYYGSDYYESTALAPRHKISQLYQNPPGNYLVWVRLRIFQDEGEDLVSEPIRMKITGGQIRGYEISPVLHSRGYLVREFELN